MFKVIIRNLDTDETVVDNLFEDIKLVKKASGHPLYPEKEKAVSDAEDPGEYLLHLLKLVKDPPQLKEECPVVANNNAHDSDDSYETYGYFGGR